MTIDDQIDRLRGLTVGQLQAKYLDVFGEATNGHNKAWLVKRIAWRLQAKAEGDLSERARQRAEELANDADLRVTIPKAKPASTTWERTKSAAVRFEDHDDRLPLPGTILSREYKGRTLHVRVLADGFEWDGQAYPSLSAVAKAITGSHVNGFHFFRLTRKAVTA
ncbi:DUF2924 domain-containing protein [soil metagenome]